MKALHFHSYVKFGRCFTSVLAAIFICTILPCSSSAQLVNSGEILRAGIEDANLLLTEYLKPFGGGFGADLNAGWITSAKPLKKFGFDLRISANASYVPSRDRLFDVNQLDLRTVRHKSGPELTPTAFGDDTQGATIGTTFFNPNSNQDEELFSFQMPQGSGVHYVPAPMAQFSLGLPGHTQISFRYTPTITIDDQYDINITGISALVGLNSLLFNNALPLDVSLQAGFMDLEANARYDVQPIEDADTENTYPDSHWDGQGIQFNSNTFTMNVLAGKKLPLLSFFGGIGFQQASTDIDIGGSYPIVVPKTNPDNGPSKKIESIDDPINITLNGANTVHLLGGLQLKIAFLSITASYTHAEYSTLTAGIGITFRN